MYHMLKLPTNYMAQMGEAGRWLTDRDWLYSQYVTLVKSTREIAADIGCGKKAVATALKRFGIPARMVVRDLAGHGRTSFLNQASELVVGKRDNLDWMLEQFVTLNRSKTEIAAELHTSVHAVDQWLRKHDLKGSKSKSAIRECCERRYTELNGFASSSQQACKLRMRGRRGTQLQTKKAGLIWCHSSWEVKVAVYLDDQDAVIGFAKDAVCIPCEYAGKHHHHYPDFVVYTADHTTLARPQ